MRKLALPLLLLFISCTLNAQKRNLDFYLQNAELNSPLINKNKNENKIVALDLEQIKTFLTKPEINIEANIMLAPIINHDKNRFQIASKGADKYIGYDLATTDGGAYQAYISIKQPIFTNPMLKSYSNKSDLTLQVNENNIALTVHELEQIVSYQYILCLQAKMQIENSQSLLKELDDQLVIMQKLVNHAIYKQTDLMLLEIEHQSFESEYQVFQAEYRNNLYDLNLVCGINDTSIVDIQGISFQLKSNPSDNSQFLTAFRLDSLNIIAEQMITELKYKPQLNLFADAGLNATYQPSFNRLGFSTGITLSWNIFDGNQRKIQSDKSTINLNTIDFEKKNFITQNEIYKHKILNQIYSLDERMMLISNQAKQYDQLLEVYSKEISLGEVSVMDYKNILKDISAKKQERTLLEMEKQALINSYNYWNY